MVSNLNAVRALERAVSWIGRISPPGVTAYTEDDSTNIYSAGHAVFLRNWTSSYGALRDRACPVHDQTAVALLPAGSSGRARTLGGIAVAVSKYSEHREEAVAALRYLVSESSQIHRAIEAGSAPTRLALEQRPDLMQQTAFNGALRGEILTGLVERPSVVAGSLYDDVSRAYYTSIRSALKKETSPALALARLQAQLTRIMATQQARIQASSPGGS